MSDNKRLFMTCGKPVPLQAETFVERGQNMAYLSLCETHKPMRNGQNALVADGRILAYKAAFIKRVTIPPDMIANDVFTYFACRHRGYEAKYTPAAIVYFRGAQTIEDRTKQNARSAAVPIRMTRYFPKEFVRKEMHVPFSVSVKSKIKQFFHAPISSMLMYGIHKYCEANAVTYDRELTAVWPIALTTKHLNS